MLFLGFFDIVIGALAFIFVLGTIVLVHEGGHFYFASKAGVLCREYCFGMGPLLFGKKKGETLYSVRAFPIGGFCAIAGEESEQDPLKDKDSVRLVIEDGIVKKICFEVDLPLFKNIPLYKLVSYDLVDKENTGNLFIKVLVDSEEVEFPVDSKASYIYAKSGFVKADLSKEESKSKYIEEYQIAPYNRQLNAKTLWQRTMTIFGGPMTNIILAFIAFILAFFMTGTSDTRSARLSDVTEGTSAFYAGLDKDDVIYKLEYNGVNGLVSVDVNKWNDISTFMDKYKDDLVAEEIIVHYYDEGENTSVKSTTLSPTVFIYSISMYQDITSDEVKIGPLSKKSKAYKGGLREGDIILSVNGNETDSWKDVYHEFRKVEKANQKVKVLVSRNGEEKECEVTPYSKKLFEKTQSVAYVDMQIGISPTTTRNVFMVMGATFKEMGTSFVQLLRTLWMLITSNEIGLKDMSGVIGIFNMTSDAANSGFSNLLYWMGFLSINVGIMNLLPIPALDGGRLVFIAIEAVRGKPVSQKVQDKAINITMILLLALMVYVAVFDVLRFF